MSLYKKAWWFVVWTLAVLVAFPLWMSVLGEHFGSVGFIAGAIFWLSHGAAMIFLFRCPECGLSPFQSRKGIVTWATPWPRKACGHCGRDHRSDSADRLVPWFAGFRQEKIALVQAGQTIFDRKS